MNDDMVSIGPVEQYYSRDFSCLSSRSILVYALIQVLICVLTVKGEAFQLHSLLLPVSQADG